jgi:hypothetical protein
MSQWERGMAEREVLISAPLQVTLGSTLPSFTILSPEGREGNLPKHSAKNRINMFEMIIEVKPFFDLRHTHFGRDIGISL